MLTKDDLGQIAKLLETEREQTRKIVQEEVREAVRLNNAVLSTIIKFEIPTLAAATKAGFQEMVKQIKGKDAEQDERIEALEEHTGLVKPHKN
jgi:hypothetical protein